MDFLTGKKSYIVGGLIALVGILAGAGVIPNEAAQEVIFILLGVLGITLRKAIANLR